MPTYSTTGALNVAVVDGSTYVGRHNADGKMNVIERTTEFGSTHPSGACLITIVDGLTAVPALAADGSVNVIEQTTEQGLFHPCGAMLVDGTV